MTKLIIFDLGGILVPEKWPYILDNMCKYIGTTEEEFLKNTEDLKIRIRKGDITLKELYIQLLHRLKIKKDSEEVFKKHFELYIETSTERNKKIIELIELLKINYKVVCLTNTEKEISQYNRDHGLFDYFDKVFLSCDMGVAKPDPKIYERVLEECNCSAEEAIFIDNDEEYIEGARHLGINCVLFENVKQLKMVLQQIL
ncbi:hypothetical protein COV16_04785 [Candidatus Woesearchaeota archaeon CG10_big_fil_rev_8_21_14_0_10_34_8]|nr:MAG: hypothetical protein COV16_04785 [Candidatus Woesearchaeota archaeon CG10_big_fil_rev_8_21_14_0_10_34_8]